MKLLLTSGGVTNDSIRAGLVDLLGRPIEEATALCTPTAQWGHPTCGPESIRSLVTDGTPATMAGLGWRSVGVLELTALPTLAPEGWHPWVRVVDGERTEVVSEGEWRHVA